MRHTYNRGGCPDINHYRNTETGCVADCPALCRDEKNVNACRLNCFDFLNPPSHTTPPANDSLDATTDSSSEAGSLLIHTWFYAVVILFALALLFVICCVFVYKYKHKLSACWERVRKRACRFRSGGNSGDIAQESGTDNREWQPLNPYPDSPVRISSDMAEVSEVIQQNETLPVQDTNDIEAGSNSDVNVQSDRHPIEENTDTTQAFAYEADLPSVLNDAKR